MCEPFLSIGPVINIAGIVLLAVAGGVFLWAIYNLILYWGDPETYRYVRKLFLRWCLGPVAAAWLLNQIVANCLSGRGMLDIISIILLAIVGGIFLWAIL